MIELLANNLFFAVPLIFSLGVIFTQISLSIWGMDIMHFDIDLPDNIFIGWLKEGVPIIMVLIVFLFSFGMSGIFLSKSLPLVLSAPLAFIFSVFTTRLFSSKIFKYLPKEETYAISRKTMIGEVVTVTQDSEVKSLPVDAKFKDKFGNTHYVLVQPINEVSFNKNDRVILLEELDSGKFIGMLSIDN